MPTPIRRPTASPQTPPSAQIRVSLDPHYFDEMYDFLFIKNSFALGKYFWKKGDEGTIDKFGPNGISYLILFNSKRLSLLQSGYLYHYAFIMIIGLAAIVSWFVIGR